MLPTNLAKLRNYICVTHLLKVIKHWDGFRVNLDDQIAS